MRRIIATALLALAVLGVTAGSAMAGDNAAPNGGGIWCCRT